MSFHRTSLRGSVVLALVSLCILVFCERGASRADDAGSLVLLQRTVALQQALIQAQAQQLQALRAEVDAQAGQLAILAADTRTGGDFARRLASGEEAFDRIRLANGAVIYQEELGGLGIETVEPPASKDHLVFKLGRLEIEYENPFCEMGPLSSSMIERRCL